MDSHRASRDQIEEQLAAGPIEGDEGELVDDLRYLALEAEANSVAASCARHDGLAGRSTSAI